MPNYQLFINNVDYSGYVYNKFQKSKITWRENEPQKFDFALASVDNSYPSTGLGSAFPVSAGQFPRDVSVKIDTFKFGANVFKGFMNAAPTAKILGYSQPANQPIYGFVCQAISEEIELNQLSTRLEAAPNLTGRKAGDIIKILTDMLLPGKFDYTNIDDGEYQPSFEIKQGQMWSEIVAGIANNDRYCYWVLNSKIYYKMRGHHIVFYDVTTDPAITGWNMSNMDVSPIASPIKNDIIVVGGDAPKGKAKAHFVGAPFQGDFSVKIPIFDLDQSDQVNEAWQKMPPSSTVWEVVDPTFALQSTSPNLQILGGNGDQNTYIRLRRALELTGNLQLIHGELQFSAASDGWVGSLYQTFNSLAFANLIAGFRLTKSGAQTQIQAASASTLIGSTLLTQTNHTYVLITRIWTHGVYDYATVIGAKYNPTTRFGGQWTSKTALIQFEVWDYTITATNSTITPVKTIIAELQLNIGSLLSPFLAYVVAQANDTHFALNFTEISKPPQVYVQSRKPNYNSGGNVTSLQTAIQRSVGFGLTPSDAVLASDATGETLRFYPDPPENLPIAGERLDVSYEALGVAVGRVQDSVSIANIAARYGAPDTGLRTSIVRNFQPTIRTDEDARNAAAAILTDSIHPQYGGTYKLDGWYLTGWPIPGMFINVNEARFEDAPRNVVVTEISAELEGDWISADAHVNFVFTFGDLLTADLVSEGIRRRQGLPLQVEDTAKLDVVDILNLATQFVPFNIQDWHIDVVDATHFRITVDDSFALLTDTGIEIRKVDRGWGQFPDATKDTQLVARGAFGVNNFLLPRNSRAVVFYLRYYRAGNKYSEETAVCQISYPLPAAAVQNVAVDALSTTEITVDFALPQTGFQDVWRITISRNSDASILYSNVWDLTTFDFNGIVLRPASGTFGRSESISIATWNVLGEATTITVTASYAVPVVTGLQWYHRELVTVVAYTGEKVNQFRLQIATDAAFTNILYDQTQSSPAFKLSQDLITKDGLYFRAYANDPWGASALYGPVQHTYITGALDATWAAARNLYSVPVPGVSGGSPPAPPSDFSPFEPIVREIGNRTYINNTGIRFPL